MKGFFEVRYMSNNFSILTNNNKKKIGKENSGVSISQKKQKKQRKRHPICSFIENGQVFHFCTREKWESCEGTGARYSKWWQRSHWSSEHRTCRSGEDGVAGAKYLEQRDTVKLRVRRKLSGTEMPSSLTYKARFILSDEWIREIKLQILKVVQV